MTRKDSRIGVYDKFRVSRTDGRDGIGEKHEGCRYFVLDLDCDKYAPHALAAYAQACRDEFPLLARDLGWMVDGIDAEMSRRLSRSREEAVED